MTTQRGNLNKFLSTSAFTIGLLTLGSASAHAIDPNATPTGEQIVAGSATVDRPNASTLNVNQSSDRVVINWDSFNIGSDATTEFFQPNSGSLAVNRVTGDHSDPTQILGTLRANGRVMVLDRNGVFFGANSRIDVGGIVASTGDVDTSAVMRGDTALELSNFGSGSVINEGTISVAGAGLAALVAPHVSNSGVIEAKLGKVVLASGGERATIDMYGDGLIEMTVGGAKGKVLAENSGTLSGATVMMSAASAKDVVDTVINMSGVVHAKTATVQGGKIILSGGQGGKVSVSGVMDASGTNGGGDIRVTGHDIHVTNSAFVFADAIDGGNGGSIYFKGNNNALYSGYFSARGGAAYGNGGFVELSATNDLGYDGSVNTMAVNGLAGSFLLDPAVAIIHSGMLDPIGWAQLVIKAERLADDLHRNGTVKVQATNSIEVGTDILFPGIGNGNINLATYDYDTVENKYKTICIFGACWQQWVGFEIVNHSGNANPGNLVLDSAIVNFNKNLLLGTGTLTVQHTDPVSGAVLSAPTVNLNGLIQGTNGVTTSLLDQPKITSSASTVNVISNAAKVQQGTYLAAEGGTVNVGDGTYNENVTVGKSLTLRSMNGANATEIRGVSGTGADSTLRIASDLSNVIVGGMGKGITFRGFAGADSVVKIGQQNVNAQIVDNKINGAGAASGIKSAGSGSYFTQILDNTVRNTNGAGIDIQNGSNVSIQRNTVRNTGGDGIFVNNSAFAAINANTIFTTGGDGIDVRGGGLSSTNATITNNFVGNKAGISEGANNIGGDGIIIDGAHGTTVSGNTVSNTTSTAFDVGSGIHARNSNNAGINGNTLSDIAWDGVKITGGTNVSATGNTISNVARVGIYAGGGFNGVNISGNNLTNGNMSLAGYGAISTDGGNNLSITANTVNGSFGGGIKVNGGTGTTAISGNTVDNVNEDGIAANAVASLSVAGNSIGTNGGAGNVKGNGINVATSNGAQIGGNVIENIAKAGINIHQGSNVSASGNTLTHIGNQGIRTEQVQGLTLSGNTLTDVSWTGMQIEGGKAVTASGNNLTDVRGHGIAVNGSTGTNAIAGNILNTIRLTGIALTGAPGTNTITGNNVTGAGEFGIHAKSSKNVTVTGNSTTGGKNGIVVEGSTGTTTVSGNTAGGTTNTNAGRVASNYQTGIGILVKNSTGKIDVTGNDAGGNSGDGIRILNSAGASVLGNTTNDNGDKGIIINQSNNAVVEGNNGDNNDTGIWVERSNGVKLLSNTVTGSDTTGIHLRDSTGTLVQGNNVTDNDRDGIWIERSNDTDLFANTITGSTAHTGVKVTGSSNVEIGASDLKTWVQTGRWPWQGHFVTTARGNTIANFDNGVTVTGGTNNNIVKNAVNGVDYGIRLSGTANADIIDNTIAGNSVTGIDLAAGSHNATIDGNALTHFDLGINVDGSNDVAINDNVLNDVKDGIAANAANGLTVTNNDLTGRGNGGTAVSVTGSDDVVIGGSDNYVLFIPVGSDGVNEIQGFRNGIDADGVSNLKIRKNVLTGLNNGNGTGINVRNSDGAIIGGRDSFLLLTSDKGNEIDGYKNGIRVSGSNDTKITHNDVEDSGENGITVRNSDRANIAHNDVDGAGNDGIAVENSKRVTVLDNDVKQASANGISARDSNRVEIAGNTVSFGAGNGVLVDGGEKSDIHGNLIGFLLGDGIVVAGSGNSKIDSNLIGFVGGNGIVLKPGITEGGYSDGSHVTGNTIFWVGGNGIDSYDTYGLLVAGNTISGTEGDGIRVEMGSGTVIRNNDISDFDGNGVSVNTDFGDAKIVNNTIANGAYDGISVNGASKVTIRGNNIDNVGGDGIDAENSGTVIIRKNTIDNTGGDGIDVEDNRSVRIVRNDIGLSGTIGGDGIDAEDNRNVRIARNAINGAADNGIQLDGNNRARILSNVITNSGNAGLFAMGEFNGAVILEDNIFTDNPVGAWFESGNIDLTGATNTFNGGEIALRFMPVATEEEGPSEGEQQFFRLFESSEFRAPTGLSLVDNTIGTTAFNGQSQFYIELGNGAFFAPGLPTVLNGLNASYDGFVPASAGGILTQAQYDAIESKIFHFTDDPTLGLFFFGALPGIDDEDVYNRYGALSWAGGRFRMTILGLPTLPGSPLANASAAAGQPGFVGNVAEFLANLAPAAGGDDTKPQKKNKSVNVAGYLASIEPAAGGNRDDADGNTDAGNDSESACLSDALAQASGGGAVSYSFGTMGEDSLNAAASCGGAI